MAEVLEVEKEPEDDDNEITFSLDLILIPIL